MTCLATCVCACGQLGCGCRASKKPPAAPKPSGPTAQCKACEQPAPMQSVRSGAGRVVVVIFCGNCDRRRVA